MLLSVGAGAVGDGDWFLEANLADVAYDVIKDSLVSLSGVQYLNGADWDHLQLRFLSRLTHAALLTLVRSAIP